ncbi:MAG TPA: aminotransferase class V-fold PLP-dependent enzyme [Dehalococcoidia bacterium]|nr:aminotransferase class V-fold PLP-dependent enzyme [Dehalococcoidia bacterium]
MSLTTLRDSIRATRDVIYMNTGFTGPSPEPVLDRMREVFEYEASVGPASVAGLANNRQISEDARQTVASLLHADADEVAITHGTTEGLHVVIYGMTWKPGDEFVSCSLEHPALGTPCQVLEERYGATVKRVEVAPNATAAQALAAFKAAITPRTKLVAISHVQFACGMKLPLKEIADATHAAGSLIAVDGAQTGGQMDLDMRKLGVDFYSISGQKWVLGPNGTGALWAKREHIRALEPLFTTNAIADSRALPGDAPGGGNPLMRFRIASQSPALTAGFAKAISLLQDIGMEEVEAHCKKLGDRLRSHIADMHGCTLTGPTDDAAVCGLTTVAVEGWEPRQVVDAMWDRHRIAVRAVANPPAIRFSTAPFNTEAEVDKALEALKTIASEPAPPVEEGAAAH